MLGRVFELKAMLVLFGFALAGFGLGIGVGLAKGEGRRALMRGMEAGLLALGGGLIARLFISILLGLGHDSVGASLAVGWGFLLWPGAVDSVVMIFGGHPLLTVPTTLLWFAMVVGCFTGMMDGLWGIHRWKGPGCITFLSDVTWGLAGATNGCLFHLFNFAWADHPDEPRNSAHRYRSGFRFKPGFAVTQGAVMSGMQIDGTDYGPGTDLFKHEGTHVLQNRVFGPWFTITYLGWMVALLIPAFITGLASSAAKLGETIQWWCYFDNPWEVWAYQIGGYRSHPNSLMCWSVPAAIVFAVLFFLPVMALSVLLMSKVWL